MLVCLVTALMLQVQGRSGDQGHLGGGGGDARPNVLLIVADDLGVDLVRAYGAGAAPPCTPNLDALAAQGLSFREFWADPVCSPSRAALLTGRHGFRTGIGTAGGGGGTLPLEELTLPEALTGYRSACVGKWHLGGGDPLHPNLSGFDDFVGTLGGGIADYQSWTKVVNGQSSVSQVYITRDTANEAIAKLHTLPEPWLLYVPIFAPHVPFHDPSAELCPAPACTDAWCGSLSPAATDAQRAKAMTEVLDAEIGRLLTALAEVDPAAYVFFLGDNGSAQAATEPPFDPLHAKGTPYQQGLRVPLIVRGPGVATGECRSLAGITDLFATICQLAGVASAAEDSISLVPCFSNPRHVLRQSVYAEQFSPNNASPPFATHDRAIRDARHKLIRRVERPDELYDLWNDPLERTDLVAQGLTSAQREAHQVLVARLVALGVD